MPLLESWLNGSVVKTVWFLVFLTHVALNQRLYVLQQNERVPRPGISRFFLVFTLFWSESDFYWDGRSERETRQLQRLLRWRRGLTYLLLIVSAAAFGVALYRYPRP